MLRVLFDAPDAETQEKFSSKYATNAKKLRCVVSVPCIALDETRPLVYDLTITTIYEFVNSTNKLCIKYSKSEEHIVCKMHCSNNRAQVYFWVILAFLE